jgi:hypothetical protein
MADNVTFETPETGAERPQDDQQRPEWLDPKFQSPEDLAKSYSAQQAELTRLQQEVAKLRKGEQPEGEDGFEDPDAPADEFDDPDPSNLDDGIDKLAKQVDLDLTPYQEEYFSSGDVTEESRTKIAEAFSGVFGENSRQIVDDFIESRKIVHSNDTKMIMDAAGGEEAYGQIREWASQNLPKDQINVFNKQVNSGDRHAAIFAVQGLRAAYEQENGSLPPRRVQGSGQNSSQPGFASTAEMVAAMNDPRYKKDPAYREQVQRRLQSS